MASGMQNDSKSRWSSGLGGQTATLTLVMLIGLLPVTAFAWWMHGTTACGEVLKIAGACYIATLIAIVGEHWFALRRFLMVGMLWAMAFRTGVPLVLALILLIQGGPLTKLWMIGYLGFFYIIALAAHVVLTYNRAADEMRQKSESDN
jgi:hypothetical protein